MEKNEFDDATSFVASHADQFSEDALLKFYALYKQAIEGPCRTSKPSIFDFKGRAKWTAWNSLGDVSSDQAADQYVELLTSLHPSWKDSTNTTSKKPGGVGGPVFSSLASEIQPPDDNDPTSSHSMPDLIAAVCDGNISRVKQLLLDSKTNPNERDSEGCTALHFAADHGALDIIHILLHSNDNDDDNNNNKTTNGSIIDIDAVDHDGQTALHYAALAEQQQCYELLQILGANTEIRNIDGHTAEEMAPSSWLLNT